MPSILAGYAASEGTKSSSSRIGQKPSGQALVELALVLALDFLSDSFKFWLRNDFQVAARTESNTCHSFCESRKPIRNWNRGGRDIPHARRVRPRHQSLASRIET